MGEGIPHLLSMTVKEGERKSPVPWSEYSTQSMPLPILPPDRSKAWPMERHPHTPSSLGGEDREEELAAAAAAAAPTADTDIVRFRVWGGGGG